MVKCPGCEAKFPSIGSFANHCKNAPCRGGTKEQRFWAAVEKSDGCWNFTKSVKPDGYRFFRYRDEPNGKQIQWYAHRFSWFLANGPIPEGMDVCHRCDNTACVRPDHLFVGTAKDNMVDMYRKARNPVASLTEDQVREIRSALSKAKRGDQQRLAKKYNVLQGVICDIKMGHTYRWVE